MPGLPDITGKISGVFLTYQTLFVNFERKKRNQFFLPDDHEASFETVPAFSGCSFCINFIQEPC
jgi:hypothetical protein